MAGSVNKVILVGNLGRDPEVKSMQDGRSMVNMSVATSETWRDRQSGERKERTEWHRVVIFNEKLAEVAQKFVKKGSKIYVEGQLSTRKWTDQSGQERYTTEVVIPRFGGALTMLDGRSGGGDGGGMGGEPFGLAKRADRLDPWRHAEVAECAIDVDPIRDARRHLPAQVAQIENAGHPDLLLHVWTASIGIMWIPGLPATPEPSPTESSRRSLVV